MKKIIITFAIAACSCTAVKKTVSANGTSFDFEAHRGGRGLMPENTIPAMLNAIGIPEVQTLEMDVHITKDGQVIVSHDPWFNPLITTGPDGKYLNAEEAKKNLLYQMDYAAIQRYDVGLKPHPDFPRQQKTAAVKPLLTQLLDATEAAAAARHRTIHYNIEIKSKKNTDNTHHPEPAVFVEKLLEVLNTKGILSRCIIQSFDVRPLQVLHKRYPSIKLSFLVEKEGGGKLDQQLQTLGFSPDIYSPAYASVSPELVTDCHRKGIKLVPWTVNTVPEMQKLVDMGVDGIISDYPNLFSQLSHK